MFYQRSRLAHFLKYCCEEDRAKVGIWRIIWKKTTTKEKKMQRWTSAQNAEEKYFCCEHICVFQETTFIKRSRHPSKKLLSFDSLMIS